MRARPSSRLRGCLQTRLHACLQHQWQHGGWLSALLLPLAGVTWLVVKARRLVSPAWRAPVPVVVVGNILVGGTGKTPVVIALVQALQARGWHPGVVSRGYGVAVGPTPRVRQGACAPAEVGDEPALIAAATGAPIAVHPKRARAVAALLREYPNIDVVVADDGLQHWLLARDVEIAVEDARGVGNSRLLPAGPLREPAGRLRSVDMIVTHLGADDEDVQDRCTMVHPHPQPASPRRVTMRLAPQTLVRVCDGQRAAPEAFFATLAGQRVAAAAGIGQPQRFFAMLRRHGVLLAETRALPDHYAYRHSPFAGLAADVVLLTAKDAVKCAARPAIAADPRLWSVEVAAQFSDSDWVDWVAGGCDAVPDIAL